MHKKWFLTNECISTVQFEIIFPLERHQHFRPCLKICENWVSTSAHCPIPLSLQKAHLPLNKFSWNLILGTLLKFVKKVQLWLMNKNIMHFTRPKNFWYSSQLNNTRELTVAFPWQHCFTAKFIEAMGNICQQLYPSKQASKIRFCQQGNEWKFILKIVEILMKT